MAGFFSTNGTAAQFGMLLFGLALNCGIALVWYWRVSYRACEACWALATVNPSAHDRIMCAHSTRRRSTSPRQWSSTPDRRR